MMVWVSVIGRRCFTTVGRHGGEEQPQGDICRERVVGTGYGGRLYQSWATASGFEVLAGLDVAIVLCPLSSPSQWRLRLAMLAAGACNCFSNGGAQRCPTCHRGDR